jgi:hypothetical protein
MSAAAAFGLLLAIIAFVFQPDASAQGDDPGLNLEIYPKGTSRKEIRAHMKDLAKAVGKKCNDCHNTKAFEEDNELKEKARSMMRLERALNARLKKDGSKVRVRCETCHRGEEKPSR